MFKLVIADDEGKTTVVPLVRDEISIGRKEGNTIRLTEKNISRKHARLRRANGAFTIEDLSSYNGVKVNGRKIGGELALHAGDQITIGDYQLALQLDGADATATMPDATAPSLPDNAATDVVTAMIAAPGVAGPPARLVMLSPPAPGQEFALNRPRMRLGRAEDLDMWVNHRSISREHAEFQVDGDVFRVTDLASANGIRVNGQERKSHDLVSGDVIEIGQVKLRFVAAGEHFVFDEGRTMQMDAIGELPAAGANRTPMYVAAGIVGLALLGGIAVAVSGGGGTTEPTVTPIAGTTTVLPALPPVAVPTTPIAPVPAPAAVVDVAAATAACRTALNSGDFDGALAQANVALTVAPTDPAALGCRDAVTAARAESDAFAAGLTAMHSGDLETAYMSFESLPEGSTYRTRPEFTQVMADFAERSLRSAESLVSSDPTEANRLANMVLNMSVVDESARRRADAVVRRAGRVASASGGGGGGGGGGGSRPGGGGGGGRPGGGSGSGGSTTTVVTTGGGGGSSSGGSSSTSSGGSSGSGGGTLSAPGEAAESRSATARGCAISGDHACVIRELRGHCSSARDFEFLIESMRAMGGYERDIENNMRTYLGRFPTGSRAAQYRQYLVAHSGG